MGGSEKPTLPYTVTTPRAAWAPWAARRRARGWLVLGVDPGQHGAMALIRAWPGRDYPRLEDMFSPGDDATVRKQAAVADLVVVEMQQASPQMGVTSAFDLGRRYGRVRACLEADVRFDRVGQDYLLEAAPAAWRASYGLAGGRDGKAAGMELAAELLRGQDEAAEMITRHDQADAVLLAWWGWRHRLLARATQELQG